MHGREVSGVEVDQRVEEAEACYDVGAREARIGPIHYYLGRTCRPEFDSARQNKHWSSLAGEAPGSATKKDVA